MSGTRRWGWTAGAVLGAWFARNEAVEAQSGESTPPASERTPASTRSESLQSSAPGAPVVDVSVAGAHRGSADDGYRARKATLGLFGELSPKEIPFSLHVTQSALWENRQAHTEQEVLQTNPTVSNLMAPLAPGAGGMSRTMVRGGVMGDQGVLRDGLVDRSFTYPWIENVERVEVMTGLSSLLNGFGTLGGTINYVSKRPTDQPTAGASFGTYGGGILFATGDVSGPLPTGSRARSIIHTEGGSTFVDRSVERRMLLSTIITHQLAEHVEVSADVAYQDFYARGLQNYLDVNPAKGVHVPDADKVDPRHQYGQDWTFNESKKLLAGVSANARISSVLSVRAGYRYGTMWRRYNTTFGTLTDDEGHYTEQFVTTPKQKERTSSGYATAAIDLPSGPIEHHITAGYNGTWFSYERGNDVKSDLGMSSLSAPLVVPSLPGYARGSANKQHTQYDSLILGDRAVWGPVSLLAGVNYALLRYKAWSLSSECTTAGQCPVGGISDLAQAALTPSVGLVVRPISALALYASYMEGLVQGGTAPMTAANAYEVLAPSRSRQLELGAKWDLGRTQWTAAVFGTEQINEYLDSADNRYKQDGRQRNAGAELTVTGQIVRRLTMVGGVAWLRARVERAADPALEDKTPVNVPDLTGRVFLEYAIPGLESLYVAAGGNLNGKRYVDAANTDNIDPSVTFDAGLRYQGSVLEHTLSAALFVSNLADRRYWTYYRTGAGLLSGAPRTVSLSAKVGLW